MGPKIKDESRTAVEGQLRKGLEWGAENLMLAVELPGNQEESNLVECLSLSKSGLGQ